MTTASRRRRSGRPPLPSITRNSTAVCTKAVRDFLVSLGYREAETRRITYLDQAPAPGQFCARCIIGTRKADLLLRLFDARLMAIECEVSNNLANGNKHIKKDAIAKAQSW